MPEIPRRLYTPRGRKKPLNTKIIDRRGDWGNSYKVGSLGVPDRATAARLYERDLLAGKLRGYRSGRLLTVATAKKELAGFDLACSCKDDGEPCHGDVLLKYANCVT
jgi:hypothetical protein